MCPRTSGQLYEPGDGALWLGTAGGGASRYDLKGRRFTTYTTEGEIADNFVGTIWSASDRGVSRLVLVQEGADGGADSVIRLTPLEIGDRRHLVARDPIIRTRPRGISFTAQTGNRDRAMAIGTQHHILDLAPAPQDRVWVSTRLGGLWLRGPEHEDLQLTKTDGLPSMDVNALAPVLGTSGRTVWAGTAGGATRVTLDDGKLEIERTATWEDGVG